MIQLLMRVFCRGAGDGRTMTIWYLRDNGTIVLGVHRRRPKDTNICVCISFEI